MSMNRIKMIGALILAFMIVAPGAVLANWQIYYTGKAQNMFGVHGRGNFASRTDCEAYRSSSAGFERRNSYCSGFDSPSATSPVQKGPSVIPVPDTREEEKQQLLQKEQREKELAREREKKFAEEKAKLLGTLKGAPNDIPGLKGTSTGALQLKTGHNTSARDSLSVDQTVLQEEYDFKKNHAAWVENEKTYIRLRLEEPNQWSRALTTSLKTKAPPLPYKKFDELQAGDVLLIAGSKWITKPDQYLSGNKVSRASHTIIYLKEINGTKLYLDSQPGEGPRIVPEKYILDKYGHREIEVAKLAQPLNQEEAKQLYAAAKKMRVQNVEKIEANHWFDKTAYGVWRKENMVCSEADWALIKAAGREIPKTDDGGKKFLGIDFSPADFYDKRQYFLVTPMTW